MYRFGTAGRQAVLVERLQNRWKLCCHAVVGDGNQAACCIDAIGSDHDVRCQVSLEQHWQEFILKRGELVPLFTVMLKEATRTGMRNDRGSVGAGVRKEPRISSQGTE